MPAGITESLTLPEESIYAGRMEEAWLRSRVDVAKKAREEKSWYSVSSLCFGSYMLVKAGLGCSVH